MWWNRAGSGPDGSLGASFLSRGLTSSAPALQCLARGTQPGPGQNQHPHTPVGWLQSPAGLSPGRQSCSVFLHIPSSFTCNRPPDKNRPSAQLAFSSPITREDCLPTTAGGGGWPPFSLPALCSHVPSPLCPFTMQMPHKSVHCSVNRGLNTFLSC